MSIWKKEAASILRAAANSCDFKSPCFFCAFRDDSEHCNEYRKAFIQSIVPNWLQEQMDDEKMALCYWDETKSKLRFFKSFERAISSGKDVWVANNQAIRAEAAIAHRIRAGGKDRKVDEKHLENVLKWSQIGEKFRLSEEQLAVVRNVLTKHFVVVDGGPGTGKTTILRVIYQYYLELFPDLVFCCAPTGKAAKRLSEVTHSQAQTMHRLLGATYDEESDETYFFYTKENHHPGKVFLIDEASMIDAVILASFLEAVDEDATIILVGDSHQLPSVGAGRVLADLIHSEKVNVFTLVENYRQLHDSMIVKNSSLILHGEDMVFPEEEKSDIHFITSTNQEMLEKVMAWVIENNPDDHVDRWRDIAILCPKRNGPISTETINALLQKRNTSEKGINPSEFLIKEGVVRHFAKDDRVIQVRNDYRLLCKENDGTEGAGVFNGDIGFVRELNPYSDFPLDILFDDGRRALYPEKSVSDLELAYALTVHKSQGGEWKKVLLVIPQEYGPIFNRNLLYTAVTRAKEELWILGDRSTIHRMIRSQYADDRNTALRVFLEKPKETEESHEND
ncbi:MAG: AAA family ATPase [Clostridiales bacterium]|nr:AAA family ATPase [Clostridiales bacterium]